MLKLDNNLLEELGLGSLPEAQKRSMLQHIYETLELRVGTNLANQMSDQQLEEFEKFIDEGGDANQAQALQWLESNLPNYKDVVNQVFEALKLEIKQMAPQLVASSQQQMAAGPAPALAPAAPTYQDQPQYGQPAPSYNAPAQPQQYAPQSQAAPAQPWQQPQPAQQPPASYQPAPQVIAQPVNDYQQPQQGYQPAPQGFQPPQDSQQSQSTGQPPQYPPQQAA